MTQDTLHLYVDEAGDPTLFANRRRAIVGTEGCSRYFTLGKLEVDDPPELGQKLETLRHELVVDPYFEGVPSFDPARGKFHRLADSYDVCVARRGQSDRNEAIRSAMDHAERDFMAKYGFGRGGREDWRIRVSTPKSDSCLQAVDYFLWAVQRFFEPRLDKETGASKREERFLKAIWPQVGEIHDLHFGPERGTFFNGQQPLAAEVRFGEQKRKKP